MIPPQLNFAEARRQRHQLKASQGWVLRNEMKVTLRYLKVKTFPMTTGRALRTPDHSPFVSHHD